MKKSSYQKLKEQNKKLNQDIYNMVMNPISFLAMQTTEVYRMKFGMADRIMYGSRPESPFVGGGLINQIKTVEYDPEIIKSSGIVLKYPFLTKNGPDE